jgi:aminoglycoside 3-N-acetyltransferase
MSAEHDWNTPPSLSRFCREVLPLLAGEADGARTLAAVGEIVATDRWNSFDRFHDTTRTLVSMYEAAGARAEVYPVQTGGRIGTGRWVIHEAADVRAATLDVVAPVQQRLLDYQENPWHVIQWSSATPEEGLRGDLVVLDTPEALAAVPPGGLTGRFVLTRMHLYRGWDGFAEKGAAGVIADYPVADLPDATAWMKFGWGGLPLAHAAGRSVGLVLSARQGGDLRRLLAEHGRVTLHARVDLRRYVGTHDVVSGLVPGREDPQDEVWALAHSAEPGALDNASGVAVCVEIARLLEALIAAGRLPRPRRTLRLLNAYECYGFFRYLEAVERLQTPLAGVVIDTVGSRPGVCNGRLQWHATVPQSAGFVDRVGEAILRAALELRNPGYQLFLEPFVETSDTLIGDPQYGFPAPWLTTHYRDRDQASAAYHSSADTTDLVSPEGLALAAAAMAGYLYYLADAGTEEALELAHAETARAQAVMHAAGDPSRARYAREAGLRSLERLPRWFWAGEHAAIGAELARMREALRESTPGRSPAAGAGGAGVAGAECVPRRTAPLTPAPDNTPGPILARIRGSGLSSWALFWADGNRTFAEIAAALSAECDREFSTDTVAAFFGAHADLGYVRLIDPGRILSPSQIVADLRALGVTPGMDVMIHSALSRIGHVQGGADAVVDALLEAIGPEGTLLAPSFNHGGARVFNPRATPTTNGAIPDALWRRPDAVRSLHPTHSVAAIGARAAGYCAGHLEAGIWAQESPIGKLIHGGGYLLSVGVTHESSTAYHVAEASIPCGCVDPFGKRGWVVAPDGAVMEVRGLAWRTGTCPVPPSRIDEALDRRGLQRHGRVGHANATLVKAKDLWDVHREHLRDRCPSCPIRPEPDE